MNAAGSFLSLLYKDISAWGWNVHCKSERENGLLKEHGLIKEKKNVLEFYFTSARDAHSEGQSVLNVNDRDYINER